MGNKLTTKNGMLWIQPDGPNTPVYPLGCHDLGDLEIPDGDMEWLQCWKPDRSGWDVVGNKISPPGNPSFEITFMLEGSRDYLETVRCPYTVYATMSDCGRVDEFSNFQRGQIAANVRRTGRTYSSLVHHVEDNESTMTAPQTAEAVYDMDALTVSRETTVSIEPLNDVNASTDQNCDNDCGATVDPGELAVIAADAAVAGTGDILFSTDFGESWAAGAADPFGVGFHTMAVARVQVGRTTTRIIAGREGTGAVQGQTAYSDDAGTNWTTVSIGGAAVGHGATYGHGIWAIDRFAIFLASADGYIYKSSDAGVSWAAVEAGVIHAADNHFVHFADKTYGIVGGAAGVISITNDGGASWQAGGVPAASAARCGWRLDRNRCWVGLDNGSVYYSTDGGATWTARTGFPAGAIRSMFWLNAYQGFILHNTAAPVGTIYVTNDGGYSWNALTNPDTNAGLNSIWMASPSLGYVVGEDAGGTGVIYKIQRSIV